MADTACAASTSGAQSRSSNNSIALSSAAGPDVRPYTAVEMKKADPVLPRSAEIDDVLLNRAYEQFADTILKFDMSNFPSSVMLPVTCTLCPT